MATKRTRGMTQVVEPLSSKYEALSSNSSTAKKEGREGGKKGKGEKRKKGKKGKGREGGEVPLERKEGGRGAIWKVIYGTAGRHPSISC
jgi:hypothetical protein